MNVYLRLNRLKGHVEFFELRDSASIHACSLMKTPLAVTIELMFPEGLKVTIGTERQSFSKLRPLLL
jgi:hypothetical protein